jgi:hypothetical protein
LPEDCHDPPALSVAHQLNAVDATKIWLLIAWTVASFVRAEDVSNLPEGLCSARYLFFKEALLLEERTNLSSRNLQPSKRENRKRRPDAVQWE